MLRKLAPGALFAAAVVLSPLWAGADPTSGKDAFTNALKNTKAAAAFRVKVGMEVTLGEGMQPMGISAEGWIKNPDLSYFKMNGFGGMETEAFHKGTKSCRKDAVTGEWVIEEGDEGDLGGQKLQNPLEYVKAFEPFADKAELAGEEEITQGTEKIPCIVLKMNPPAEALKGFLSGMGLPDAAVDWQKAKVVLRSWISKDKQVFRQLIADVELEIAGLQMPGAEGDDDDSIDEGGKKPKHHKKPKVEGPGPKQPGDGGDKKDPKDPPKAGGDKPGDKPGAEPAGDENPPTPAMKLTPKAKFEMFDYDKDPSGDVPKEVKAKLGIQ